MGKDARRQLVTDAKTVLEGNWMPLTNSTLPSSRLYPHQWSWDATFAAIGYSHYNTASPIAEMNALFHGQWENGLLPHIVFNPHASQEYFPGPDVLKIETAVRKRPQVVLTSGIVQPPVHALASLAVYTNAPVRSKLEAHRHLNEICPKLVKWHDYLYNERDPLKNGLIYIRHMWKSGMDNSPAWDSVLHAFNISKRDIPAYTRVDTGYVGDAKERPDDFFYDRALYLIKLFYENEYEEARIFKTCPFFFLSKTFFSTPHWLVSALHWRTVRKSWDIRKMCTFTRVGPSKPRRQS